MDNLDNLLGLAQPDGHAHVRLEEELVKKLLYRAELHEFIQGHDDDYAVYEYDLEPNRKKQRVC